LLDGDHPKGQDPKPSLATFIIGVKMQFIDLGAQRERIAAKLQVAIDTVVRDGRYILGPQVAEFEQKLAAYVGVKHVIACANGTDALLLPLLASGIGPGDAVFVPSFTFAATAEVVALAHAEPVFIDVDPTPTTSTSPALKLRLR
jgi:dTDP-4-amino-4,6-dideoxygalactose transaminase